MVQQWRCLVGGAILKPKIEELVHVKKRNRRVRSEDTAIVVTVNHRNQGQLEKLYKSTNIDWKPVERQLRKWSNLVRVGRTPQVAISFKYIRDDDASRTGDKRGSHSATKRLLLKKTLISLRLGDMYTNLCDVLCLRAVTLDTGVGRIPEAGNTTDYENPTL